MFRASGRRQGRVYKQSHGRELEAFILYMRLRFQASCFWMRDKPLMVAENPGISGMDIIGYWMVIEWSIRGVPGLGVGKMNLEHDYKFSGSRFTQNFGLREVKPLLGQFLANRTTLK